MIGVDTNVLVRYLMQDDDSQSAAATVLMESLDEDEPGYVSIVVLVELVPDRVALSYANAFLAPVRPTADRTLMDASVAALLGHVANLDRVYPSARLRAYLATHPNHSLPGAVDAVSLPELTTWLGDALEAYPTGPAA